MNGQISNWIIGSMFAVILAMTGYIATGINGQLSMIEDRVSRTNDRMNRMDNRLAVMEDRLKISR